jgi:hypothetical protein
MEQQSRRPPLWAVALITAAELAGTGLLVWSQMPSQEREWILLAVRQRCRSTARSLAVRAHRAGRAGMAEELAGRDPSAHYLSAAELGRWRDRLEHL